MKTNKGCRKTSRILGEQQSPWMVKKKEEKFGSVWENILNRFLTQIWNQGKSLRGKKILDCLNNFGEKLERGEKRWKNRQGYKGFYKNIIFKSTIIISLLYKLL